MVAAVAVLSVVSAVGLFAADAAFDARFPSARLSVDAINARDPLANTSAAFARAASGEEVPFRVLFYGQSIIGSGWPEKAMAQLQERHPDIAFQWENRAIGGYSARRLLRTTPADLADLSPDLIVFHVYGDHDAYEDIVETMLRGSAADIVLQTDHFGAGQQGRPAKCDIGLNLLPVRQEGCSGWPFAQQDAWGDFMSFHFLPALAERHGLAVHHVRRDWGARLAAEGRAAQDLLSDDIHLSEEGERWMAEMFVAFLEETAALQIAQGTAAEPRHETLPLPEPGADGTVSLTVDAVRVEAVSRAPLGEVSVSVDGTPVADLPECVAHDRVSRMMSDLVWPATLQVGADAPLQPETWTARLHDFSADFSDFAFTVTGSLTGEDGSGRSTEDFRSASGRVLLDASDWQTQRAAAHMGKPLPDPLEVTWTSRFLCDDLVEVPVGAAR